MTGNTNEKLRALFLAFIMVVSVVGMTVAFTGSAAAASVTTANDISISSPSLDVTVSHADAADTRIIVAPASETTYDTDTQSTFTGTAAAGTTSTSFTNSISGVATVGDWNVYVAESSSGTVSAPGEGDDLSAWADDSGSFAITSLISGTVTDNEGATANIPDTTSVTLTLPDDTTQSTTTTTGAYSFGSLAPGTYNVSVSLDGYTDYQTVTISDGDTSAKTGVDLSVGPTVTSDVNEVVVGATETVTGTVDVASGDSVNYVLNDPSGTQVASGSTTGDFSITQTFSSEGEYTILATSQAANSLQGSTTITAAYNTSLTTDPVDPVYGDSVSFSGTVKDADGNAVSGKDIDLVAPDGTTITEAAATTASNGAFSFTSVLNDAGTWNVTNADQTVVYDSIVTSPLQANVTVSTDGENVGGFSETYTITVFDNADNAFSTLGVDQSGGDASFDNYNGYVNVSGPFTSSIAVGDMTSGEVVAAGTNYFHVIPNNNGEIKFSASPSADASDVSVSLENSAGDGIEETTIVSDDEPDYVGSDSVTVTEADDLNVQAPNSVAAAATHTIDIGVLGSDGLAADGASSNNLKNVSVTLSGPGVDAEKTGQTGSPISFTGITPSEAGTITATVTAYADDGTELGPKTANITVTGDKVADYSPSESSVEQSENISVDVTRADGTPVNNRVVTISSSGATFDVVTESNGVQTVSSIEIDGSAGTITADPTGSAYSVDSSYVVNNGHYEVTNVTFVAPGDLDITVEEGATTTADLTAAITVSGVDAYEVQSDIDPFLSGSTEQTNFTVVNKSGAQVTGSELTSLSLSVDQEGSGIAGAVSTLDRDGDGNADTFQTDVSPTTLSDVNVTVATSGSAKTGKTSFSAVAPSVEANVSTLTEGLQTDVQFSVVDPRDGSALSGADLQVTAANGTVELQDLDASTGYELDDTESTNWMDLTNSNLNTTLLAYSSQDKPFTLDLQATADGANWIDAGSITIEEISLSAQPDSIPIGESSTIEATVTDAQGNALGDRAVSLSGATTSQGTTDENGFVAFLVSPSATGTINVNIATDGNLVSSDTTGGDTTDDTPSSPVTGDTVTVLSTTTLQLTADNTTVTAGSDVTFTTKRTDTGNVANASVEIAGKQVYTGSDGQATVTLNDSGTFTATASKMDTTSTTFTNDTLEITVEANASDGNITVLDDPATNLDDDPQLEDVNGNGGFDIGDVQGLYANRDSDAVQNNVDAFDFNANGEIDIGDIQALYVEYQNSQ